MVLNDSPVIKEIKNNDHKHRNWSDATKDQRVQCCSFKSFQRKNRYLEILWILLIAFLCVNWRQWKETNQSVLLSLCLGDQYPFPNLCWQCPFLSYCHRCKQGAQRRSRSDSIIIVEDECSGTSNLFSIQDFDFN